MWVLRLNHMRDNAECRNPIVRAETREQLEAYVKSEMVEPYTDSNKQDLFRGEEYTYNKVFRKGGPLEWFNPPRNGDLVNVGTIEDAAERGKHWYETQIMTIPQVQ